MGNLEHGEEDAALGSVRAGSEVGSSPGLLLSERLLLCVAVGVTVLLSGLEIASLPGAVLSEPRWGVGAR